MYYILLIAIVFTNENNQYFNNLAVTYRYFPVHSATLVSAMTILDVPGSFYTSCN